MLYTVPTREQSIVGRNTISSAQMASYTTFLDTELDAPFASALIALSAEDAALIARHGYSAVPQGKDLDGLFCAAWDKWVAGLDVKPPKSHKWIKGVLAAALILS
jgi:hypothetical protein